MNRERLVLAVDFDDVVVDHTRRCIQYYNQKFGGNLDILRMQRFFDPDDMDLGYEEAVKRITSFHESGASLECQVLPSSKYDLPLLTKYMDLHVVTARQSRFADITYANINQNIPEIFKGVHFANHFSESGQVRSKLDICKSIGAVGLIDDSGKHVTDVADGGLLGFLFGDYAWNRSTLSHPNVIPIQRLSDILDFFKTVGVLNG